MGNGSQNQGQSSVIIGLDVGSTTIKAVVVNPDSKQILWKDYQRHYAQQAEKALEVLRRLAGDFAHVSPKNIRVFITGSGGGPLAEPIGAKFVQEVNAVTMAVEQLHPDVGSVIELGGQDAKIIIFRVNDKTGDKQAIVSMNDKCASGTGVVIDKCMVKVGMPIVEACRLEFDDARLHHVAAKCGVFAETDIVNLMKSGIPAPEIMCSLADAIVKQNLSVLTRGNILRHRVLLLGGPNKFLPFLQVCWQKRIPEIWQERGYEYPRDACIEDLIFAPENAEYYAAYGAVIYGMQERASVGQYKGMTELEKFIAWGRKAKLGAKAGPPLVRTKEEFERFRRLYEIPPFQPTHFAPSQNVRAVIGLDGGSTSSKAVLLDEEQQVLLKVYQLSKGNPMQDTKEILRQMQDYAISQNARLEILGLGVTGYAGDILEKTMKADVNIVETIAHMIGAIHYFGDIDVICDVGGQDIKVLFLKNGDIRNFRLSNQCSAGNGMLLQVMADQFGIPIEEYAHVAFQAELSPVFSYGCGVFLDTDRVHFQKEGFSKEELLAGLALVLPKNIWQYVAQIPRLAKLGRRFVLQGGTQHNLAAVKAQVDYIQERVPDTEIHVHPHAGEAGAIGAALETLRMIKQRGYSTFIGIDTALQLRYTTRNDESTRCTFCSNRCGRTFIGTQTPDGQTDLYISGFNCEKGTVESKEAVIQLTKERQEQRKRCPNLVEYEARRMFQHFYNPQPLPDSASPKTTQMRRRLPRLRWNRTPSTQKRGFERSPIEAIEYRRQLRIGIPRALAIWSTAPFWRTYFETLDLDPRNIVFSDYTSEPLWREGSKYGSIDPCFPSKVALAHVHNLLFKWHEQKPLHYIVFPCVTHLPSHVQNVLDLTSCPIVAGVPNVAKAAFTKQKNLFAEKGIVYLDPAVTFTEPNLMKKQLYEAFKDVLRITHDESDFAAAEGWSAMRQFDEELQERGRIVLEQAEQENRLALLMIGRPYHSDPHLHHGVLEEFQRLGYPILSMRSIPKDEAWLRPFFLNDLSSGRVRYVQEVSDVWPENFSSNSVQKVWAAKFSARHPNVAVLDLSSFKCGHDAPTYGLIDAVVTAAGIPYMALHDIDANKPAGSLKLRIKTYAHSLKLYEEDLQAMAQENKAGQSQLP